MTSDETYRDMGVDPAAVRDGEARREEAVRRHADERERLRVAFAARHRDGCAVYENHGIPSESCGSCTRAFEQALERTGR